MFVTPVPGRIVPIPAESCGGCGAVVWTWRNRAPDTGRESCSQCSTLLSRPEPAAEHIRNSLQILAAAEVDEFGCVLLTPTEYQGIRARLVRAATQLEVRAALP
jgi:hypothetical protein